jgi:hypothetical protein
LPLVISEYFFQAFASDPTNDLSDQWQGHSPRMRLRSRQSKTKSFASHRK